MDYWDLLGYLLAAASGAYFVLEVRRAFFLKSGGQHSWNWFAPPDLGMAFCFSLLLGWAAVESFAVLPSAFTLSAVKNGLVQQAIFAAIILSYLTFRKIPLRTFFHTSSLPAWKTIGLAVLLIAAFLPMVQCVANLLAGSAADDQEVVQFFRAHTDLRDRAWVILLATVVAPFTEELLFRGFLYRIFQQYFGRISSAFFVSVLFAMIHGHLLTLLPLTLLAIGLTVALEKSGSLIVPMIMHSIFNSVSLFVIWYFPDL